MAVAGSTQKPDEFHLQAVLLSEVVGRILKRRANLKFTHKPTFRLRKIVEFRKRMRISGLEKFDEKTYIATINFYLTKADMQAGKAVGALIIYISEIFISSLMQKLHYPADMDEDDEAALEDAVGTFCNVVAGNFKAALEQLNYPELVMSHFSSFQNEVLNGVAYDPTQTELYEISFEIDGEKRIVAELTLAPLKKITDSNSPNLL